MTPLALLKLFKATRLMKLVRILRFLKLVRILKIELLSDQPGLLFEPSVMC
jgi:hypothetical protein